EIDVSSRASRHRSFRALLLVRACAAENSDHTQIALVTGILVHGRGAPHHRHRDRPGPRVHGWRIHGELIIDRVGARTREALDQSEITTHAKVEIIRRSSKDLVVDVGRFDDECLAFPVAARIAEPLFDDPVQMWPAINWNETRVVNHLGHDRHELRCLEDLIGIVVAGRYHRARHPARDAAIGRGTIFPRICGARGPRRNSRLPALPARLGERWHFPSGGSTTRDVCARSGPRSIQYSLYAPTPFRRSMLSSSFRRPSRFFNASP